MGTHRLSMMTVAALALFAMVWAGAAVAGQPSASTPSKRILGIDDLARAGRWEQVLAVARLRERQLPLKPAEALVAAGAARRVGDQGAETAFLEQALGDGLLAAVAEVELAGLTVASDAQRAADLALQALRRKPSLQLRGAAVEVLAAALSVGVAPTTRVEIDRQRRRLGRSGRRALDLALAADDDASGRQRLGRLLSESVQDSTALAAAERLVAEPRLSVAERWRVAHTQFRHGLYAEAAPRLESLADLRDGSIRAWEVTFLRGRCAFRVGRWGEASTWYRRAIPLAPSSERRARLEVHLARSLELQGALDDAVEAARRAVVARAKDDRRLFLARLRLRQGNRELAALGVSRARGRTSRERGQILIALDELRKGEREAAGRRLRSIRHRPWFAPAAVIMASVAADAGRWPEVLSDLERAAAGLDPYWQYAARRLMARVPRQLQVSWRQRREQDVAGASGARFRRGLHRWAALETDAESLRLLVVRAVAAHGLDGPVEVPAFRSARARTLWDLGLEQEAVRWFAGDFPRSEARQALWSARAFVALGAAPEAITASDLAWKMASPALGLRLMPRRLREAYHPLPWPQVVKKAAQAAEVPWTLLAAVAREESRWKADAVSGVGARGLTQMMPATAAEVAGRLGRTVPSPSQLFEPATALTLGAAELARLIAVFGGRTAPAVAAYNAGEAQARLWLEQCGPGCSEERFVIGISFSATRGYVANVLASDETYAELYGVNPAEPEPEGPGSAGLEPVQGSESKATIQVTGENG